MRYRVAWSIGVAAVGLLLLATVVPVTAQTQASARNAAASAASSSTAPRTPWGDPDLQGTYTNTYENGTPFERPDEFAGRKLEEVTGDELKAIKRATQKRTIAAFLGPEHAPDNWWQDNLDLDRGSQAWFVVDPADGKIPPMTAEARQRVARAEARKASGRGPADSHEDRVSTIAASRAVFLIDAAGDLRQSISDRSGARIRRDHTMIHETRHPSRHVRRSVRASSRTWVPRAAAGKGHARRRDDELLSGAYRNANAATLKLTERFQRIAADRVRWTVTVDDPKTWTRPWTFSLPLTADPNPMPLYECHEGNYGLKNILSAARAEERPKP
jgi:hypothetical protein